MNVSKKNLEKYYASGLSMMEIAKKLNCSHNKIAYWMNKHKIKRRNISNALYKRYNPNGDPFKIKTLISSADYLLYGVGLGIYWGEGNKADKYSVRVGTSDPEMIIEFRHFLLNICQVEKRKFKYSLICFKNADKKLATKYWAKKLNILPKQLGKVTQVASLGKGTYKKISPYGVCTIYVFNTKLKKWLMEQLKSLHYNRQSTPS